MREQTGRLRGAEKLSEVRRRKREKEVDEWSEKIDGEEEEEAGYGKAKRHPGEDRGKGLKRWEERRSVERRG